MKNSQVDCCVCGITFSVSPARLQVWAESGRDFDPTDWECPECREIFSHPCYGCLHWNNPRWGCELATECPEHDDGCQCVRCQRSRDRALAASYKPPVQPRDRAVVPF